MLRHPILRKITACTGTANLFGSMGMALEIVFLVRVLRVRPADTGLLIAVASVGGVAGGLLGTLAGVRATLWISYAGSWAAGWWVFFSPLRRQRDLEDHGAPGGGIPGQGGREPPDGAGPQLRD